MMAKVTTRLVGNVIVVDVSGRITVGGGSNALSETLRSLTCKGHNKILVNLREVTYIDSGVVATFQRRFDLILTGVADI